MSVIYVTFIWLICLQTVLAGRNINFAADFETTVNVTVGQSNFQIVAPFVANDFHHFATYDLIRVFHRNLLTSDERLLGSLTDYFTPQDVLQGYSVSTVNDTDDNLMRSIVLQIDTVKAADDGRIIFMLTRDDRSYNNTIDMELLVLQPLDSLKIGFDNRNPTSSEINFSMDPGDIDNVTATVSCIAEGSNPRTTDVKLTLDGVDVPFDDIEVVRQAEVRKYRTQATAEDLTIDIKDSRYKFQCVATDPTGETHTATANVLVGGAQGLRALHGIIFLLAMVVLYNNV